MFWYHYPYRYLSHNQSILNPQLLNIWATNKEIVLYNLYDRHMPSGISFPNAKTLTLINVNDNTMYYSACPSKYFQNVNKVRLIGSNVQTFQTLLRFKRWEICYSNPIGCMGELDHIIPNAFNKHEYKLGKLLFIPGYGWISAKDYETQFEILCNHVEKSYDADEINVLDELRKSS